MRFVRDELALPSTSGPPPVLVKDVFVEGREGTDPVKVALTGFMVRFTRGDHLFGQVQVDLDHAPGPTAQHVRVRATLSLRDWSGEHDDPYEGFVKFVVISGKESR